MALTRSSYERAVAVLESLEPRGMRPGLERTEALLDVLGNPHVGLSGALVAGTNGKGSVCAIVDSVCRAAGLRTVTLTKPHLISYCERFMVDGVAIDEEAFAGLIDDICRAADALADGVQPTAFEMLTAAGFLAARRAAPDVVICEVGLGGRLDSTNVLDAGVAVVTNVGLDHCDQLGDTVEKIAAEKAAIIKQGNSAVTGATAPALDVISVRAAEAGASLTLATWLEGRSLGAAGVTVTANFAERPLTVTAPLLGNFQIGNVATAVATCDALRRRGHRLDATSVQRGCASATWPGRMQWVAGTPSILLDGAHNLPGMEAMVASAGPLTAGRRVVTVFAVMRDKDAPGMARALAALQPAEVVVTAPDVPRATPADELAALFRPPVVAVPHTPGALETAMQAAGEDGVVVVCGSLYLVGEALAVLGNAP